jgi:prepilin-type processing-associated H-X9-DG protein
LKLNLWINAVVRKGKAFTIVELLIVISVISLLTAMLLPALNKVREAGRRSVCLSNIRQLTTAWTIYSADNSYRLVNAAPMAVPGQTCPAGYDCQCPGSSCDYKAAAPLSATDDPLFWPWHERELPWIGPTWNLDPSEYDACKSAPENCQRCAIETGALYRYVRQFKIYACPRGKKGELATYQIVDEMNGEWKHRSDDDSEGSPVKAMCFKFMGQIRKSSERVVFIDEGLRTPDSYAVYYHINKWFDSPPVRHGNGTTVSFADGHSEYWKWRAKETIDNGRARDSCLNPGQLTPATCPGMNDLYKMQIGCWGKIGYVPVLPPGCILEAEL